MVPTVLGIFAVATGSAGVVAEPPATLRAAAAGKFLIGTALSARFLDNPKFAAIAAVQFDAVTAGNEFKPSSLHPKPDVFNFGPADRIARFASEHGQVMIGHTLCWHNQTPAWFFAAPDGTPLPREQGLANLKNHIDAVVGHFRGHVRGWDVVNEAIDDGDGSLRDTPARRSIGDDYILRAFEFAHAADPSSELYYNDYNIEGGKKRDAVIQLIRDLKAAWVQVDAVGIQGHWGLTWPTVEAIEQGIVAFQDAGIRVQITELDIDVLPRRKKTASLGDTETGAIKAEDNPYAAGIPDAILQQQADRYAALFKIFVKHRDAIKRVTLWGLHDGGTWLNDYPIKGRTNYPLLFDRQFQPKPAFDAVLRALSQ